MHQSLRACRSELVWDGDRSGTAGSPRGDLIRVGLGEAWTPSEMISVAIQTSLMIEFLEAAEAAGLEVLGYLSSVTTGALPEERGGSSLLVSPCIVLARERDLPRARDVLERARARSWICGMFAGVLDIDPSYSVASAPPSVRT